MGRKAHNRVGCFLRYPQKVARLRPVERANGGVLARKRLLQELDDGVGRDTHRVDRKNYVALACWAGVQTGLNRGQAARRPARMCDGLVSFQMRRDESCACAQHDEDRIAARLSQEIGL